MCRVHLVKSSMDGMHLVISCTLSNEITSLRTFALVATSTTGISFIDKNFASLHSLTLEPLGTPRQIEVIDGRFIDLGAVTHVAKLGLYIN